LVVLDLQSAYPPETRDDALCLRFVNSNIVFSLKESNRVNTS